MEVRECVLLIFLLISSGRERLHDDDELEHLLATHRSFWYITSSAGLSKPSQVFLQDKKVGKNPVNREFIPDLLLHGHLQWKNLSMLLKLAIDNGSSACQVLDWDVNRFRSADMAVKGERSVMPMRSVQSEYDLCHEGVMTYCA